VREVPAARSAVRYFRDAGAPVQEALSRETLAEAGLATLVSQVGTGHPNDHCRRAKV
jgi:hypothetical protein